MGSAAGVSLASSNIAHVLQPQRRYPEAIKIRLVQDNLNTHDISAFYEHLPADQTLALAQRFEFFFTPKAASSSALASSPTRAFLPAKRS